MLFHPGSHQDPPSALTFPLRTYTRFRGLPIYVEPSRDRASLVSVLSRLGATLCTTLSHLPFPEIVIVESVSDGERIHLQLDGIEPEKEDGWTRPVVVLKGWVEEYRRRGSAGGGEGFGFEVLNPKEQQEGAEEEEEEEVLIIQPEEEEEDVQEDDVVEETEADRKGKGVERKKKRKRRVGDSDEEEEDDFYGNTREERLRTRIKKEIEEENLEREDEFQSELPEDEEEPTAPPPPPPDEDVPAVPAALRGKEAEDSEDDARPRKKIRRRSRDSIASISRTLVGSSSPRKVAKRELSSSVSPRKQQQQLAAVEPSAPSRSRPSPALPPPPAPVPVPAPIPIARLPTPPPRAPPASPPPAPLPLPPVPPIPAPTKLPSLTPVDFQLFLTTHLISDTPQLDSLPLIFDVPFWKLSDPDLRAMMWKESADLWIERGSWEEWKVGLMDLEQAFTVKFGSREMRRMRRKGLGWLRCDGWKEGGKRGFGKAGWIDQARWSDEEEGEWVFKEKIIGLSDIQDWKPRRECFSTPEQFSSFFNESSPLSFGRTPPRPFDLEQDGFIYAEEEYLRRRMAITLAWSNWLRHLQVLSFSGAVLTKDSIPEVPSEEGLYEGLKDGGGVEEGLGGGRGGV
ncbi:hypothetical protein BDY24DRAFT_373468 [Mrakia frigida]|uniref:uncharacterized protein n=1 Tax=Mrakia frigida TaxID=29902 RepID=UPI003FCBF6DE